MGLFEELKRRNVFRVAAAYLVASWLLIEASSVLLEAFGAPEWVPKTVAILLAIGFPIALFFAWAFEVTPEGVKREADVDRTQSITSHTARRLDLMTMALLVAAIVLFLSEGYWRPDGGERSAMTTAVGDQPVVSIAVLPFENMSADAENEYFADGISEEILNLLAGVRDLEVASRTSAFAYKGTSSSIPDIASALGVRYVLEGSVRKAGEQVRITAQLIDSSNDRHLWSETYDRTLNDIFAIQDEIAGAIGAALQVELLGASGQRVTVETIDPELYADFLEARHLLRRRNYTDMAAALELLRGVVVTEPDFARGQAILSEAYMHNGLGADAPLAEGMAFTRAREHADRAIALNPDLAVPYTVLALITQWGGGDKLAALEYYGRAIELEPDEPRAYHWRGILYGQAGYVALAEADFRRGLELEPENANLNGRRRTSSCGGGTWRRPRLTSSRRDPMCQMPLVPSRMR
jgi:TolB-like protein